MAGEPDVLIIKQQGWKQRLFRNRAEDTLPVAIEHQRIYIVPSYRGCAFLCALLLMLVASVNYALSLGYALCFLLTGMFAATLLHTYRNLAGISVEKIEAKDCFRNEEARFSISLSNAAALTRHGIDISTRSGESVRVAIDGHSTKNAVISKIAARRGSLNLGRITLKSDWPLGLWTSWSYLHVPAHCLVFPLPEADAPPLPLVHSEGTTPGQRQSISAQGDISGLRDYVPGDSPNLIAWKKAARGSGLQVRTFEAPSVPDRIILNLQQTRHKELENQLSRLCAWVLQADSRQAEYALQLPGSDIEPGMGALQKTRALQTLALHGQSVETPH